MWARGHCRISPLRFLAECCRKQLNQGSFVLLHFRLFTFSDLYCICLSVFSCTGLFFSISQVIGCEDRLRNDLYCVEWGVKLYSNQRCLVPVCRSVPGETAHSRGEQIPPGRARAADHPMLRAVWRHFTAAAARTTGAVMVFRAHDGWG